MRAFEQSLYIYQLDNDTYPADVSRGIVPIELIPYLSNGKFPVMPYPGGVYDWDNVNNGTDSYIQLGIRFCESGTCQFPNESWAANFDNNSAAYFCYEGNCRSHPDLPESHPGHCFNC